MKWLTRQDRVKEEGEGCTEVSVTIPFYLRTDPKQNSQNSRSRVAMVLESHDS